jgi:hypothetical protein
MLPMTWVSSLGKSVNPSAGLYFFVPPAVVLNSVLLLIQV